MDKKEVVAHFNSFRDSVKGKEYGDTIDRFVNAKFDSDWDKLNEDIDEYIDCLRELRDEVNGYFRDNPLIDKELNPEGKEEGYLEEYLS